MSVKYLVFTDVAHYVDVDTGVALCGAKLNVSRGTRAGVRPSRVQTCAKCLEKALANANPPKVK